MRTNRQTAKPPSAVGPSCEAAREETALSAYLIWEQEGRPEGRDLDHWLQAEAQVKHGCTKDAVQQ